MGQPVGRAVRLLESGVPGLDRVLGGGIPEGDVVLLMGPAGSGKTVLSFQIAVHAAASNHRAVYVSTLSEPPARLIKHVRSMSFFEESLLGDRLFLLNVYPIVKQGLAPTVDALIAAAKEYEATLLVVDGLDTVRDIQGGTTEMRTFIYDLAAGLSAVSCTTLVTNSATFGEPARSAPELTMSDGIVLLDSVTTGTETARTIQVTKMRGMSPILGVHTLHIDGRGTFVHPRVETLAPPSTLGLSEERLTLGLPELDGMLGNGLLRGSVTLLAGAPGTGKTLLGMQYMLEGARRGQRGLVVGFRESPRMLIDKMRGFGMDLETPIANGLISIVHRAPVDLLVDQVFAEILDAIARFGPDRLAIDSVAEIEHAVVDERRRRTVMTCLAELLRSHRVTAVLTRELSQVAGPELDFSETPLAILAENLLLLRYVEFRSDLYRIVSILRLRDSPHDRSIRQYDITRDGFRVLQRLESAEGLLTGIARLPSEMRVKRTGPRPHADG